MFAQASDTERQTMLKLDSTSCSFLVNHSSVDLEFTPHCDIAPVARCNLLCGVFFARVIPCRSRVPDRVKLVKRRFVRVGRNGFAYRCKFGYHRRVYVVVPSSSVKAARVEVSFSRISPGRFIISPQLSYGLSKVQFHVLASERL